MVHASIKEGIRACLAAKKSFEHNSLASLREAALAYKKEGSDVYVVVESLYSMDGDEAPLKELATLSNELGFALIVDEAHTTGLFGINGRGLIDECGVRDSVFISTHPCGKAIGAAGSFVCASEVVTSYLINKARTMIFTTALPPIVAATIIEVLKELKSSSAFREKVLSNAAFVRERLQGSLQKWKVSDGRSPIIPLIVGEDTTACAVADAMLERGFDIRPIRPPTVAEGTSRFRLTINALHTREQLEELCTAFIELETQYQ
jgi:8-amino-7-oxononanoate synthase